MTTRDRRILVADDRSDVVEALRLLLKGEGFKVETASSPTAVLEAVSVQELDLVLMDLNYARDTTSGREGFETVGRIRELDSTLPVIVMTAWATIEGAVEAVRRGAQDYIQKPWDTTKLLTTVRNHSELAVALRRARRLEVESARQRAQQLPELIAAAPSMQPVIKVLEHVAPSTANVLILGEHGTGKEVIARWLHARSSRSTRSFVAVDAGGLAPGVFESELFGHVRGAFTDARSDRIGCFELADTGTLFLDEIGNVPMPHQIKLLRVLQTGEFHPVGSSRPRHSDVRIIAATNADLKRAIGEGRFREDLLYRLNTVEICLPALRERREDIPRLATFFLECTAARYGRALPRIDPSAMAVLLEHNWPGNVRELEHAMERALLMAGKTILPEDLGVHGVTTSVELDAMTLEQAEFHIIKRALARSSGSVSAAAAALGLSRSALYRRLEHHGIRTHS